MNNKIGYAYIINLQSTNKDIDKKIKNVDWGQDFNYYIMPAVNGHKVKPDNEYKTADWWKIDSDNNWFNRDVKPGEFGCALSHLKVIEGAYKDGYDNILILEEDFISVDGSFPSPNMFLEVPKDCSILYLGRNTIPGWVEKEEAVGSHTIESLYCYNTHAYIVTRKGMKEILNSNIKQNIIPWDEAICAFNNTSIRNDAVAKLGIEGFKTYAFKKDYFNQTSNKETSTTENPIKSSQFSILDISDWDKWCKKYIHPLVLNKEYDLAIDEPAPHVYTFPLFTKKFCKELIELGETKEWTNDRHEFYPTTDNLLEVLGMDKIYNKLVNEHIKPLAINRFQLEGRSWDYLADESFIIRYKPEEQAHLSLHHDHSSFTTLVNLNSGEFKGGGTYFPKYKCLVNPKEIGMCTLHPGNITHKHGARPVTEGTRYVVVSFIKNKDLQ